MAQTPNAASPLDMDAEEIGALLLRYQRPLLITAVVVAVGAGAFALAKRSSEIKETRAAEALSQAETIYSSGDETRAQDELKRIVTRYAGTAAGAQAAHLSAQLAFEAGNVDDGLATIEPALAKAAGHQRPALLALRAAGMASKGEHASAASDFEAAASSAAMTIERQQYQMEAARQHVLAGNFVGARAIYEGIAEREDSGFASEARLRLGEIITKS